MRQCVALLMAAGSGVRLGGEVPKQYRDLGGTPMLRRSMAAMRAYPAIDGVQVVIGEGQEALYAAATAGLDLPPPVIGGATRQASVRRGLEALADDPPALVLVHEAARSCSASCSTTSWPRTAPSRPWSTRFRPAPARYRSMASNLLSGVA